MGGPESKSERTRNFRARGILGSLNLMGLYSVRLPPARTLSAITGSVVSIVARRDVHDGAPPYGKSEEPDTKSVHGVPCSSGELKKPTCKRGTTRTIRRRLHSCLPLLALAVRPRSALDR